MVIYIFGPDKDKTAILAEKLYNDVYKQIHKFQHFQKNLKIVITITFSPILNTVRRKRVSKRDYKTLFRVASICHFCKRKAAVDFACPWVAYF